MSLVSQFPRVPPYNWIFPSTTICPFSTSKKTTSAVNSNSKFYRLTFYSERSETYILSLSSSIYQLSSISLKFHKLTHCTHFSHQNFIGSIFRVYNMPLWWLSVWAENCVRILHWWVPSLCSHTKSNLNHMDSGSHRLSGTRRCWQSSKRATISSTISDKLIYFLLTTKVIAVLSS